MDTTDDPVGGAGVEVMSWYAMMDIGQAVTLRVPADRLRDVSRIIKGTAWGGHRAKFYPICGCRPQRKGAKRRAHP